MGGVARSTYTIKKMKAAQHIEDTMNWKKLAISGGVILIASIAGVFIVYRIFGLERIGFGTELAKALIQIGTVLVLGQTVSILIDSERQKREQSNKARDEKREKDEKDQEKERQRVEQQRLSEQEKQEKERDRQLQHARNVNELRKELLARLTSAYSDAKRIRRLIRARSFLVNPKSQGGEERIVRDVYDEYLQALNNVQLTLETIYREVETSKETSSEVFSDPSKLLSSLDYMESYLRKIIREYEKKLRYFEGEPPSLELKELARLSEFIGDAEDFDAEFVSSYKSAQKSIRKDILAGVEISTVQSFQ